MNTMVAPEPEDRRSMVPQPKEDRKAMEDGKKRKTSKPARKSKPRRSWGY